MCKQASKHVTKQAQKSVQQAPLSHAPDIRTDRMDIVLAFGIVFPVLLANPHARHDIAVLGETLRPHGVAIFCYVPRLL